MSYLSFCGMVAIAIAATTALPSDRWRSSALGARPISTTANCADSTYTLSGKIEGMHTGWVFLVHAQAHGLTDSVKVDRQGQFVFSGKAGAPEYCALGINGFTGTKDFRINFFLESGALTLKANKDSMDRGVVSGAPTQNEYRQFQMAVASNTDMAANAAAYRSAEAKNDNRRMDSLEEVIAKKQQEIDLHYVPGHPHSYVSAFILYTLSLYNPDADKLAALYKGLDAAIQDSYFGRLTNESIAKAINIDIGKPAPDFTQMDINGKPVTLSSFKGRYVLVDFWASWCGPCRAENPAVLKAYRAYHAKGFDILGVSLDEKKDKWLEAVKKDGLGWQQVSDLKGWENSVAQLYGVQGIPMNYLLDKDGKIIAKGLRGEDLEKTLAELVH